MSLSTEQKAKMRAATAGAAAALVEDIDHIRAVLNRHDTSKAELRRLSAVIRRLVVDGDLPAVAGPRLGKLTIKAPDRRPFYDLEKRARIMFFASGGAPVFGVDMNGAVMLNMGQGIADPERAIEELMAPVNNAAGFMVDLRIDGFQSQRVLCYAGNWVSRKTAIKYIANFTSGVHSQNPVSDDDRLCAAIRAGCSYRMAENGEVKLDVRLGSSQAPFTGGAPAEPVFDPNMIDPLLMEVLAAGSMLANSPDIIGLERLIRDELGISG
jgi:hypothetical protein